MPAIGVRVVELYTTPFGEIGKFRFWRLLPAGTVMLVIRCRLLVKAESATPSFAVFGPAAGAMNRSSYRFVVPSVVGYVSQTINAVRICENGLQLDSIKKQRDCPALQTQLVGIRYLVEVCIEPGCAVYRSGTGTGNSSDYDGSAGAGGFCWSVPCHQASVRENGAGGNARCNLRPEAQVDRLPGLQETVGGGVVCCYLRSNYSDACRCAVHCRRRVYQRETTDANAVEIVSDYNRGGLEVRGVVRRIVHVHDVVKLTARQRSAATHDGDLLGNCQPWDHYRDDLGEVRTLKGEKYVTAGWNAAVAEIDHATVHVKDGEVNSRGAITVWIRRDGTIGIGPGRAESPSREAADSIVLKAKDGDCGAAELQSGDGLARVVDNANHVVVGAVIV